MTQMNGLSARCFTNPFVFNRTNLRLTDSPPLPPMVSAYLPCGPSRVRGRPAHEFARPARQNGLAWRMRWLWLSPGWERCRNFRGDFVADFFACAPVQSPMYAEVNAAEDVFLNGRGDGQ